MASAVEIDAGRPIWLGSIAWFHWTPFACTTWLTVWWDGEAIEGV